MQQANRIGLGVALALHAGALALLLTTWAPARQALVAAAPLMVDLIAPPRIEPPKPKPPTEPPRPKPVVKQVQRPIEPPPVLTAPAEAPSPVVAPPPPPPAPPPPIQQAPAPLVVSDPVFNADYLNNPEPIYPSVSRRVGEQGRVVLRVLVNAGGTADEIQVRTSSGFLRLDDAAKETVRRWRFVPARRGTEPLAAWVLIPISFRLER